MLMFRVVLTDYSPIEPYELRFLKGYLCKENYDHVNKIINVFRQRKQ